LTTEGQPRIAADRASILRKMQIALHCSLPTWPITSHEVAPGPKYKAALGVAYGLRVSEVASLKVSDIDSKRMLLRIEQGKGRKDPVLLGMATY
jgi:integrase